jgi:hypothetical protein
MSNGGPSIYNWFNDADCHRYFVHAAEIMSCVATAEDQWGHRQPLRQGYYNPEADAGFGREKALQKHYLWVQPILDTIHFSHDVHAREHNRVFYFHVFHQDGHGGADQEVTVLITTNTWYGSVNTPDHQRLGVMTAYCTQPDLPGDPIELRCPDWVNSGPHRV